MEDKNLKRQRVYKIIMLVVLVAAITFMLTTIVMYSKFETTYNMAGTTNSNSKLSSDEASLVKTLNGFKAMLKEKYIGEINESALIEGAIKGYVEGLNDPYTEYLTKEEMDDFMEETNAEYVGIGVYVSNDKSTNTILVVGVMKNSPALEAGIQAGDIIEKIDGVEYEGSKLNDATKVLKGKRRYNCKCNCHKR